MKIQIGGSYGVPAQLLDAPSVSFVAEDGRTMFDVSICGDGVSIAVTGISSTKVDGVIYESRFHILPNAANSVTIRANKYED